MEYKYKYFLFSSEWSDIYSVISSAAIDLYLM